MVNFNYPPLTCPSLLKFMSVDAAVDIVQLEGACELNTLALKRWSL